MEKNGNSNGILIRINGKVQGVGFRPYVWQLAQSLNLYGDVSNNSQGVLIHLWQDAQAANQVEAFLETLPKNYPPLANIQTLQTSPYHWEEMPTEFKIIHSSGGTVQTHIIPDAATCPACLTELNDPTNRRYHYPFINCTHCGPRFTIVERIPYDRENTSMKVFPFCPECKKEYEDPMDRRFHAQPNACPVCGPHVFLCQQEGAPCAQNDEAVTQAVTALEQGQIVAIKGLGGFHLACDALNLGAVECLRQRKSRPSKPLAVMLPDEQWLRRCVQTAHINELIQLLRSPAAPIVLVQQHAASPLCKTIAPLLHEVGVMLPANPLQHLLLQKIKRPLVMTSGNARGKPPAIRNEDALAHLAGIADLWLMHNRDIVQRADDSVIRFSPAVSDTPETLRRARGYTPDALPLPQGFNNNPAILAMGGDLKNAFCILRDDNAVMSQHLGDMEDLDIQQQVQQSIALFRNIYQFTPQAIAIDAHPGYVSHALGKTIAQELHIPIIEVMHHHAHIVSCMAEHGHAKNAGVVIGLALDGLGYGKAHGDATLWGGECLIVDYQQFTHFGGLPVAALPGGDVASHQPWRNLLAHFLQFVPDWQNYPEAAHIPLGQAPLLQRAIERGLNAPKASSAGRLFDAVAAALGIAPQTLSWEGEAACQLEALAQTSALCRDLNFSGILPVTMPINPGTHTFDLATFWAQWLAWQAPAADRAYAFHHALAQGFSQLVRLAAAQYKTQTIVLSGGVMHNTLLRQLLLTALRDFKVLAPTQLPAGDGGLAYGQVLIAAEQLRENKTIL